MFRRLAHIALRSAKGMLRELAQELRQISAPAKLKAFDKLQLGAGPNTIPGWGNIDLEGSNICWDLTRPLPVSEESIRFIYTEHFIEHVSASEGRALLLNCFTALAEGGVIRLSTPDLRVLVRDYVEGHVVEAPHGGWFPQTPCQMINEGMRLWGHQYLYDESELIAVLRQVGFARVTRVNWGESECPELRGLETRPDFGDLVVEAYKAGSSGLGAGGALAI